MAVLNVLICRVCSLYSEDNESIFEQIDEDDPEEQTHLSSVGIMLADCLGFQLEPSDGYPERVCNPCRMQLFMFYNFKAAALRMHEKYTEKLHRKTEPKQTKRSSTQQQQPKENSPNLQTDTQSHRKTPVCTGKSNAVCTRNLTSSDRSTVHGETCEYLTLKCKIEQNDSDEIESNSEAEVVRSLTTIQDDPIALPDVKQDFMEMDEVYLDEEFHIPAIDTYEEVEEADETEEAVQDQDERNSEVAHMDSTTKEDESDETVDNDTITVTLDSGNGMTFNCSKCPKTFPFRHRLKAHMERHTTKRPVPCSRCEKRFKNKHDLKIHYRCHDDLRKYKCDMCDKAFRAYTHMTNHRESHVAENTLHCSYCGQLYKTRMTLRRHIESMHTHRYNFVCPMEWCNKTFGLKFRLQRHIKTHRNASEKSNKVMATNLPS